MKKIHLLLFSLLITTFSFAQKKEKIKGTKIVTVTQKEIGSFDSIEIEDNLEIFLAKGGTQGLEIEADENLHEVIMAELNGSTLRLYTAKEVTGSKKLSIRVTYTDNLKSITAKNEVVLNSLTDLQLDTIAIKNLDYSKSYLNVKSGNFSLSLNDKTTAELNLQAESTAIELSKGAQLKALIASPEVKIDMYQKSIATIEGDAANAKIRLDNNATFTGRKFSVKNMELISESYTTNVVNALETIIISVSGKSQTQLLGKPKVTVLNFADSAVISKKEQ
ncbi:GIN domain-containing protein [Flavobacterium cerinum]|uniref:DUF2807 domain-containing protein n=1 Tax=Flavobacterium cerinum TaxID=2502784 RepID=A0A444HEA4_9FLAO|nr:DUF2807 domain-containing protein [Flavobacterium cerinum]RWX02504.1 DUF2807 domain-containing protein [Flavobacterium cerinum]